MSHYGVPRRATLGASLVAAIALTVGSPAPALAEAEDGTFAARGIGARGCGEIVGLLTGEERDLVALQLSSWVAGYLSHANRTTPATFEVMPIQDVYGVATIVARLCENNPEALVEPVMAEMIALVASGAQPASSEIMSVSTDEQEVQIREAAMIAAQRELIARGHLEPENDDGVFGPRTRAAFEAFQAEVGLAQTGLPDALTLFLLFEER